MEEKIQNILKELYEIDNSLKEKEEELKKLIEKMILSKPDIKINDEFRDELKSRINNEIIKIKLEKNLKKNNFIKYISFFFSGAILTSLAIFLTYENIGNIYDLKNILQKEKINLESSLKIKDETIFSFRNNIIDSKSGFGNLKSIGNNAERLGGGVASSDMSVSDESLVENPKVSKMSLISPNEEYIPEVYRYSFSGELNIDLSKTMSVYKKEVSNINSKEIAKKLENLDFNGINLSNFSSLGVSSIVLNQDKSYGYNLNIDFTNNTLNIFKNWEKWPQVDYENTKQIFLNEEEIIKIATDFLNEYNIDLSSYGKPKVETSYINLLKSYNTSKIMPEYASNITNVVFPLIVDNKEIMEEYGQYAGVRIEVDLKEKKASSLSGLSFNNYLKSDYQIETNKNNILKVAGVGGRYGFYDYGTEKVNYIDKELENPRLTYTNIYKYNNGNQEEYIIPTIIFDVKDGNNKDFTQTIKIPLVKDFYKYDSNGNIIGINE